MCDLTEGAKKMLAQGNFPRKSAAPQPHIWYTLSPNFRLHMRTLQAANFSIHQYNAMEFDPVHVHFGLPLLYWVLFMQTQSPRRSNPWNRFSMSATPIRST